MKFRTLLPLLLLAACGPAADNASTGADTNAVAHADDWYGTYTGTIPCADCEGIRVTLRLDADLQYQLTEEYLGKSGEAAENRGTYVWDEADRTVILLVDGSAGPQYRVGNGQILQLDEFGDEITGELADQYVLSKQ